MKAIDPVPPVRRLFVPAVVSVCGIALLVGLGVWQLERRAWKHALIATLSERLAAAPVDLPPPAAWPTLTRDNAEFRRVRLAGEFLHDREALVYAVGSAPRGSATGLGYLVFTPLRLADGQLVMVDRGFVPDADKASQARPQGQVSGQAEAVGLLRFAETRRPLFAPSDDPGKNLFFVRDPAVLADAKGISVAPFYVDLESPEPPGGLPRPVRLAPDLPDNHLQYALTWFALAIALAVIFAVWVRGARRPEEASVRPLSSSR